MAVVFEGFSIREHVSKVRSIDVVKCWPFGGASSSTSDGEDDGISERKKQAMESLLPPITVIKYRWWSEELDRLKSTELANIKSGSSKGVLQETQPGNQSDLLQVNLHVEEKSDERLDMLECPVCGAFAASTVNALNAHVDDCLAQASRKERRQMRMASKSRTPKKRSIVEIFAVAPQIHKVDDASDDDNLLGEDENINGSFNGGLSSKIERPNKKKKKKKVAIVKKLMKKNRKLKNKNQNMKKDGLIGNKENRNKLKQQTPFNFNRKPNNKLSNRRSTVVSILRKKPSLKCLSAKKKGKMVQASKPIVDNEKPIFPVRGILKNPTKTISGQNTQIYNAKMPTQVSTCGVQHSVRHVSFSGKDDILGPHKKHMSSFEKNICHMDLDSFDMSKKGQWIEGDKEYPTREIINGSDDEDTSFSMENGNGVQAITEKQHLPEVHDLNMPRFLIPSTVELDRADKFLDKSLASCHTAFPSPPYTGPHGHFSAVKEIEKPFVNSQVCRDASSSNHSSQFVDYFGDHSQEVAAINSKENPRVLLSSIVNESTPFTSQYAPETVPGHALSQQQPVYPLSSIELMGRVCPFPEWKQVAFREKYREEGYFGLPLNSHGELVRAEGLNQPKELNPASASNSNPVLSRGNDLPIMRGKHFIESTLPNSQLNLFPVHNHVKEKTALHLPARLGPSEWQDHRKEDGQCLNSHRRCNPSVCPMDSDLNLRNISYSGCVQYEQFQNQKGTFINNAKENADKVPPPTMRLMGKDVTVCQSSDERQRFADGKIWTDKEIIREHHPQSTVLQNSYIDRHPPQDWHLNPSSESFRESPVQRFEIESNQALPSSVLMKPVESNFFHPGLNWKENPEFQSSLTIARNPSAKSHLFAQPPTSSAIFKHGAGAVFQEPFISKNEIFRVSSELPSASTSHRIYQNIRGSCVELKYKQNLPNAVKSSFSFPFLHPDHGEHVQPTWSRTSSKSLIPWLLQTTQQVNIPSMHHQPFPDVGGICYSRDTQASVLTNPLVSHLPIVSFDRNPMISHSHVESPVGQPSIVHPSLISAPPRVKPISSVNMSCRDRMKLKSVGIQDSAICQQTGKRPRAIDDYSMMPIKIPNLGIQDRSMAATQKTRQNFIDDIPESVEADPYRGEAGLVGWVPTEYDCNTFGTSALIDSAKIDGITRPGPMKLTAGVKHILKPSQNVEQDNSRLIHSAIPFASVTDCGSILEAQKKSTKIYRF